MEADPPNPQGWSADAAFAMIRIAKGIPCGAPIEWQA